MTVSRIVASFDAVRADVIYGWRQLRKKKVTSAAAVLSLGLALGACTAAFRLIDALLWRPLPISSPERLYGLVRQGPDAEGRLRINDAFEYPLFTLMRARVRHDAELIAVSYASRVDVTYASDREMEKGYLQYVSGWMFDTFGLRPAAGRLLTESDDRTPHAHPYAVLSYDYWSRRFGRDPAIVGRTMRIGRDVYTIVGVAPRGFTGTEPGTATDIFVPTMMHDGVTHSDWSTFRILAQVTPGTAVEPLRDVLRGPYRAFNEERAKTFTGLPPQFIERFFRQTLLLEPAAAGVSNMQAEYRTALAVLGALVALVLIIACVNVANLLTGQAAARAREIALRVSIGAGRSRLVQLVLVESLLLAALAAVVGGLFAWWSAPFVVSMINPADNPARLSLPADWRVFAFGLGIAAIVTCVFGLGPALRASSVKPSTALKGADAPRGRSRLMHGLIVVQVAFCVLVLFVSGLFVTTFDRLSRQSTGFSSERLLTIDTTAASPQSPTTWEQVTNRLRDTPGVETAALAGFSLLSGNGWNGSIAIGGATPSDELAYFLAVSPEWRETMRIPLLEGRDLRSTDTSPGIALVNMSFVNHYFRGVPALGRSFEKAEGQGKRVRFIIVGIVGDARYRNMREPITPTAYVPFASSDERGTLQPKARATLMVRTASANPMAMARTLREEIPRIHPAFRASNIRTQEELNQSHTVRERMLAMLATFFAMVAVVLAGVGLYGVLHYSVLQRRKEIGICLALGARARHVAHQVTAKMGVMVAAGGIAGIALGFATSRYAESLFYEVTSGDPANLIAPSLIMAAVALVAALPPLLHAVRIDPVTMLRSE